MGALQAQYDRNAVAHDRGMTVLFRPQGPTGDLDIL